MFVTDYDGTLLTDDRRVRSQDLNTLSRLKERGVKTVIATGRSLFSFLRSLESMTLSVQDLGVDYLIFSTGAGIMDLRSMSLLRALDLSAPKIRQACAFFDRQGFDFMVHAPIPDTPYFLFRVQGGENPDFQARIALYPAHGRAMDPKIPMYERATQVLAIVPPGQLGLTRDEVQSCLGGTSVVFATSPLDHRSTWIEVFHPEASKSRAADWLCRRLNIRPVQVAAVGNDYNDLDLLSWAGKGFVVKNGPEKMKEQFWQVGTNNSGGVTQAVTAAGLLS